MINSLLLIIKILLEVCVLHNLIKFHKILLEDNNENIHMHIPRNPYYTCFFLFSFPCKGVEICIPMRMFKIFSLFYLILLDLFI